jgi:Ca-activated chloride channel family protein
MLVFEGSGCMTELGCNLLEEPRIFEARCAIHNVVPDIAAQRRLGLFIYGSSKTCLAKTSILRPTSTRCGGAFHRCHQHSATRG